MNFCLRCSPVLVKSAAIVIGGYYLCGGCIHHDPLPLEPEAKIVQATLHNPHGMEPDNELEFKAKQEEVVLASNVAFGSMGEGFDSIQTVATASWPTTAV